MISSSRPQSRLLIANAQKLLQRYQKSKGIQLFQNTKNVIIANIIKTHSWNQ